MPAVDMRGSSNHTSGNPPANSPSSDRTPFITVAICTRNRSEFLAVAVAHLLPQLSEETDLLIVDNGSTDETAAWAAELAAANPAVRAGMERLPGIAAARNAALRQAHGKYVLFFDDDQLPASGWLEAYLRFLHHLPSERVAAVGGAILPQVEGPCPAWFDPRCMTLELGQPARKLTGKTSPGCGNCAYDRQMALDAGGFCVGLDRYEECDLNTRLQAAGYEIWWLPHAAIYHRIPADRLRPRALSRAAFAEGRAVAAMRLRGAPDAWRRRAYRVTRLALAPFHFLLTTLGALATVPFHHGRRAIRLWQRACRIAGFATALLSRPTPGVEPPPGPQRTAGASPSVGRGLRLCEVARNRARRRVAVGGQAWRRLTFLIPHHNAAEFLEVSLHAIRWHHPDSTVLVADSSSAVEQYRAARAVCRRFDAELIPFFFHHGHAAQLNFLLRRVRSELGVFLDQDCVLLASLTPLFDAVAGGKLLVGPRDQMRLTHANLARRYPKLANEPLRLAPDYIHASLMVVPPARIRELFGNQAFYWDQRWNAEPIQRPFQVERYYGLCERLRRFRPESVLPLDSRHTGYGLGMVYLWHAKPLAYHQWYSGRVFRLQGKIDAVLDTDWLRAEMARFIHDYWAGTLTLD